MPGASPDFELVIAALVVAEATYIVGTVITLDRRHFAVVRPSHREPLLLLPAA